MIQLKSNSTEQRTGKKSEAVWPHLKRVIAKSSGFKRWVIERDLDSNATGNHLDTLVHAYLRQTLETLAY
ncbi:MAG: hypothetical protein ACFCU8_17655 [Thermosynechococcaceae cyanobacterium]